MPRYLDPEENMFLLGVASRTAQVASRFLLTGPFKTGRDEINDRAIGEARRIAGIALAALKELHGEEETDDMFFNGADHLREGVVYIDLLYRFLDSKGRKPTYELMKETLTKVIVGTRGLRQILCDRVTKLDGEFVTLTERFFSFLIDEMEREILLREKEEEKQFRNECSRLALL